MSRRPGVEIPTWVVGGIIALVFLAWLFAPRTSPSRGGAEDPDSYVWDVR